MIERVLTKHNPIRKIKNRTLPRATPVVWWWAETVTVMAELVVAPLRLSLTSHLSNGYSDLPSLYLYRPLSFSIGLFQIFDHALNLFPWSIRYLLVLFFFLTLLWMVGLGSGGKLGCWVDEQPYLASFH